MDEKDCVIYSGDKFILEWYYDKNGKINNIEKFRNEGDGIYAFKPQPDRYLSFFTDGKKGRRKKVMETTYDKFINSNPKRKAKFEKEYNDFLLSEFILEKMEQEHVSVRTLAKKAGVSPTVIQKIRTKNAERINFRTLTNVLHSLGYKLNIERI